MKTLFFSLALCVSLYGNAQRNSLSISYGRMSNDEIINNFTTAFSATLYSTLYPVTIENLRSSGAIALTYHRFNPNKRIAYGLSVAYERTTSDIVRTSTGRRVNSTVNQVITTAAEGKFLYNKASKKFNMYGLVGAGYTFGKSKYGSPPTSGVDRDNYGHFNFQVTPLGIQYGSPLVKGFLEFGLGYKGIVSGGVQFNF